MHAIQFRRLVPGDAAAFRKLRVQALSISSHTFAEEPATARCRSVEDYAAQLMPDADGWTFGAFHEGRLVGMACLTGKKEPFAHIAKISSVYVSAAFRSAGVAGRLLDLIETAARGRGISRLTLAVAIQNVGARRFYDRRGYEPYGIEPCAMRIGGMFVDEELRGLFLVLPEAGMRISAPSLLDHAQSHRLTIRGPLNQQQIPGIEAGLPC